MWGFSPSHESYLWEKSVCYCFKQLNSLYSFYSALNSSGFLSCWWSRWSWLSGVSREQLLWKIKSLQAVSAGFVPQKRKRECFFLMLYRMLIQWLNLPGFWNMLIHWKQYIKIMCYFAQNVVWSVLTLVLLRNEWSSVLNFISKPT